jgi:hypothetical protein
MMQLNALLAGATAAVTLVAALIFLRFWRSAHDRFFLFFAISFALEAANRILLGLSVAGAEDSPAFYLPRLCAYVLILVAIIDKNRRRGERAPREPE